MSALQRRLVIAILVLMIAVLMVYVGFLGGYQQRQFDEQREACSYEFLIHEGEGLCFKLVTS